MIQFRKPSQASTYQLSEGFGRLTIPTIQTVAVGIATRGTIIHEGPASFLARARSNFHRLAFIRTRLFPMIFDPRSRRRRERKRPPTKGTRHGNGWGQGYGWGGPAKGAGRKSPRTLAPGCSAAKRADGAIRREVRDERLQVAQDVLYRLVMDETVDEMTRLNAAVRLLTLIEGPPKPMQPRDGD